MFERFRPAPANECIVDGHAWSDHHYRASNGFRRLRTCDRCHRTTVNFPAARPAHHQPAHARTAA